jgi:integrase
VQARAALAEADKLGAPSKWKPKAGGASTPAIRTFGDFIDKRYAPMIADRKAHAATIAAIKSVFADWLSKALRSISYLDVERLKAQRLKGDPDNDVRPAKPATVNRDLDRIRAALNAAQRLGLIERNPVPDVKRLKVDNKRVRYLAQEEERQLRKALLDREKERRKQRKTANTRLVQRHAEPRHLWSAEEFTDHLMPLVLLAMNTGLRRGELLGLTWESVDLQRRQLTVEAHTAKSGRVRHVPLNAEALAVLTRWKSQGSGSGPVFPGGSGKGLTHTKRSWEGLLERAELSDFRFHDLRHHFASRLAMSGVDLYTVKELLGHSDFGLTSRYAHLTPEHNLAAVEKLTPMKRGKHVAR